jgi:peptidyl-tRNA hydrolase, PTH1 family
MFKIYENNNNNFFVVGLGNPGNKYHYTRHNIGFMVIDKLIDEYSGTEKNSKKGLYEAYQVQINQQTIYLFKPLTYMNLSGKAVQSICSFYKVTPANIIVVYDDIALPLGKLRIRKQGSSGGHNGIKSIIELIGQNFIRIRIGIKNETEEVMDLSQYVLGTFNTEEKIVLQDILLKSKNIIYSIFEKGISKTMNEYN